jgi:hypothetical protein
MPNTFSVNLYPVPSEGGTDERLTVSTVPIEFAQLGMTKTPSLFMLMFKVPILWLPLIVLLLLRQMGTNLNRAGRASGRPDKQIAQL